MLEELAFQLLSYDETTISNLAIGIYFLGFFIALKFQSRKNYELQRAPYFAISMLIYFMTFTISLLWLLGFAAMAWGMIWALVGVIFFPLLLLLFSGTFMGYSLWRGRATRLDIVDTPS